VLGSQTPPASGRLDELGPAKRDRPLPFASFCPGRRRNPEGLQIEYPWARARFSARRPRTAPPWTLPDPEGVDPFSPSRAESFSMDRYRGFHPAGRDDSCSPASRDTKRSNLFESHRSNQWFTLMTIRCLVGWPQAPKRRSAEPGAVLTCRLTPLTFMSRTPQLVLEPTAFAWAALG
jgi:hypothetical protein